MSFLPKISIVVIGYSIEQYIANCIKTCLMQNYPSFEVVFVDDGSTDRTLEIAETFRDNNLKIIHKTNGGIVSARKEGLRNCNGDYVLFVDGDDWLADCALKNFSENIDGDEDLIISKFYYQTKEGSYLTIGNNYSKKLSNYDYFQKIMSDEIPHFMFAKLYRKDFLIEAGYLEYKNVSMAEDLMTNALISCKQPVVKFIDKISYYYRFNKDSLSRKGTDKLLEQIKTIEYIEDKFKSENLNFDYSIYIEYQKYLFATAYIRPNTKFSTKQKILRYLKKEKVNFENPLIRKYNFDGSKKYRLYFNIYNKFGFLGCLGDLAFNMFKVKQKLQTYFYRKKRIKYFKKRTKKITYDNKSSNIFLIGTSDRSNIGDHAIAESEMDFLKKYFAKYNTIEITGDHYRFDFENLQKIIKKTDIIFITGGGFLGDLWMDEEMMVRQIIQNNQENLIIAFPQTIFFADDISDQSQFETSKLIYNANENFYIFTRDRKSYDLSKKMIGESRTGLYPDMALFLDKFENVRKHLKKQALVCFRKDKEAILSSEEKNFVIQHLKQEGFNIEYGTTLAKGKNSGDFTIDLRTSKIFDKLNEFGKYELVVTDRLHGMILSLLSGSKCIAFDNSSGKVLGVSSLWLKKVSNVKVLAGIEGFESSFRELIQNENVEYPYKYLDNEKKALLNRINDEIERFLSCKGE